MWYASVIGYAFAILIGTILTKPVVDCMWDCLGWKLVKDTNFRPDNWQPKVIGVVERTLYVAVLQIGKGEVIGFWLALKVAGQWKRWGEEKEFEGHLLHGRSVYQNFLIGNALSILYAFEGYKIINWITYGQILESIIFPAMLIISTLGLWFWLRRHRPPPAQPSSN